MKSIVLVKDLSVAYNNELVLDAISFALHHNEHLAILGASGSGKTMMAKVLHGELFPKGILTINGDTSFVRQHYFFKNLSNQSDFYYQQRYNSSDSDDSATILQELKQIKKDEAVIHMCLKKFSMLQKKDTPLLQLSSGEHKRFQLIRTFLSNAKVIILDNPFDGLDPETRTLLKKIINKAANSGKTIIIICHASDIPSSITHILFLENGRMKYFKRKKQVEIKQKKATKQAKFQIQYFLKSQKIKSYNNIITMKNVTVDYKKKSILKGLDWEVQQYERWLIKGPNGIGKSTLLSLITGDNPQVYANDISLFDKKRGSGETIWDIKKQIGYVSPELHWYFPTTASCFDIVASGFFDTLGIVKRLSTSQEKEVLQWLQFIDIQSPNETFGSVSTGHQRLLLLARALIKNPPLLVLDEPCQGLDEEQVNNFLTIIDIICRKAKKTLLYVSHYEKEIPKCITHELTFLKNNQIITRQL